MREGEIERLCVCVYNDKHTERLSSIKIGKNNGTFNYF